MKRVIISFIIYLAVAMIDIDKNKINNRQPTPIVYQIESLPQYWRQKQCKDHIIGQFNVQ
jgi:hypothetical protein